MKSTEKIMQLLVRMITEVYSIQRIYIYTVVGSKGRGVQTSER